MQDFNSKSVSHSHHHENHHHHHHMVRDWNSKQLRNQCAPCVVFRTQASAGGDTCLSSSNFSWLWWLHCWRPGLTIRPGCFQHIEDFTAPQLKAALLVITTVNNKQEKLNGQISGVAMELFLCHSLKLAIMFCFCLFFGFYSTHQLHFRKEMTLE